MKSVEAYDHHVDKWTYLPEMIEEIFNHAAVSMGNKLFVIGETYYINCQVFDSYSRKFTIIYSEIKVSYFAGQQFKAYSIDNFIVAFQQCIESHTQTVVYLYNVDKEKWINVQCDFTKNMFESSFVKYYTNS